MDTSATGGRRSDHKRALVPRSTAAAATSHGARTRFRELESVPAPPVGFSCAVHRNCNKTSWMLAQRLPRSFSRQGTYQPVKAWRAQRLRSGDWRWFGREDCRDQARLALPGKRASPRDHLVQHAPEREDVGGCVGRQPLQLLRRHVLQCADQCPHAGERLLRRDVRHPCAQGHGGRLGQSKVQQPRPALGEHDVAGLQVSMDDGGLVRCGKAVSDLDAGSEGLVDGQLPARETLGERLALQELHDQEVGAVLMADVEERADVRVRERRDGLGFPIETQPCVRIAGQGRREDLDRDGAVQARVVRLVDLPHPPGADAGEDFVGAEPRTRRERHQVATSARIQIEPAVRVTRTPLQAGERGWPLSSREPGGPRDMGVLRIIPPDFHSRSPRCAQDRQRRGL